MISPVVRAWRQALLLHVEFESLLRLVISHRLAAARDADPRVVGLRRLEDGGPVQLGHEPLRTFLPRHLDTREGRRHPGPGEHVSALRQGVVRAGNAAEGLSVRGRRTLA